MEYKDYEKLIDLAKEARERAYVPYSHFKVGACVLTENGKTYQGCNIENASYGLTNCAERTALFNAYANGERKLKAIAVVADTEGPVSPCGACRQVMMELGGEDMVVILSNMKGDYAVVTVKDLLPGAFTSKDLRE
ncbi:cytidine deaminase [Thermoanaerobacter thermohydrosulfuricus]|jgi:cytidine deaminase|uniref:Cytidine deaminase n=3 Tax=Thermoanaerobacter TaxID=1754 RepID=I9KQR9_9THEO|nr:MULTISPECIES: cytidine deaminase [Thermoanaerobacter]EGD52708.1 cytidine deaminase [Thermoanaerobacter ethanolicus JW 200]HHY79417.1 cytidine deaminase [Thermoanaerobacter sp.]EIV99130.1 cytidine deaminase, homotetrameric [Thermoanaerobacter siderophilus SR4]EMT38309.1 cytidine deaminase, homotetrameric [Thermoanaerobacter thermohydrosulfuricus WC1]UZQ83452.1 cytidine deaminase [Thermoanaerobacter sp. RKWS2]